MQDSSGGVLSPSLTRSSTTTTDIADINKLRLNDVHCWLTLQRLPVVIYGPSGSKTTALHDYCTNHKDIWPEQEWFDATNLMSLQISYLRYGKKRGVLNEVDHGIHQQLIAVQESLEAFSGLLVFYRCSQEEAVLTMIPSRENPSRGIIIAAEAPLKAPQLQSFPQVRFEEFSPSDAVRYLKNLLPPTYEPKKNSKAPSPSHDQELLSLYKKIGGTPLWLALAAGCIREPEVAYTQALSNDPPPGQHGHSHLTIGRYLEQCAKMQKTVPDIATTVMTLTLKHLRTHHPWAYHAISFYCHLPKLSSEDLLQTFLTKYFNPNEEGHLKLEDYTQEVANQLEVHHCLLWAPSGHRVIRPELLNLQQKMLYSKKEFIPYLLALIQLLCETFVDQSQSTHPINKIQQHEYFFDLYTFMLEQNLLLDKNKSFPSQETTSWLAQHHPAEFAFFFLCFGRLCWFVGQTIQSITYLNECAPYLDTLALLMRARWYNWLAVSQMNLGLFTENRRLFTTAIELANHDPFEEATLLSAHFYHNYALNEYYASEYIFAEELLQKAMESAACTISNDSLEFANFSQDHALILYLQNDAKKRQEAISMLKDAYSTAENHFKTTPLANSTGSLSNDKDHCNDEIACEIMHRYAAVLITKKQYSDALDIINHIIDSHTYFPKSLALKGLYMMHQRDFTEARNCFERVLEKQAAIPLLMNCVGIFSSILNTDIAAQLKTCQLPLIMEPWLIALWKLIEITGDQEPDLVNRTEQLSEYAWQWIERYQDLPQGCPMAELCWVLLTLLGKKYHIELSTTQHDRHGNAIPQKYRLAEDVTVHWIKEVYPLSALVAPEEKHKARIPFSIPMKARKLSHPESPGESNSILRSEASTPAISTCFTPETTPARSRPFGSHTLETISDGNCLFHAFALWLLEDYQSDKDHSLLHTRSEFRDFFTQVFRLEPLSPDAFSVLIQQLTDSSVFSATDPAVAKVIAYLQNIPECRPGLEANQIQQRMSVLRGRSPHALPESMFINGTLSPRYFQAGLKALVDSLQLFQMALTITLRTLCCQYYGIDIPDHFSPTPSSSQKFKPSPKYGEYLGDHEMSFLIHHFRIAINLTGETSGLYGAGDKIFHLKLTNANSADAHFSFISCSERTRTPAQSFTPGLS